MSGTHTGSNRARGGWRRPRSGCGAGIFILGVAVVLIGVPNAAAAGELVGQVTAGGHAVREAVVYVDELRLPPVGRHARMDQRNRTFIPHVLAVQLGTHVAFPNDDTVYHNVFSFREGKRFDLGLYPVGRTKIVDFNEPGLVRIFCNIHSNMSAFIWVLENPFFEVTGASGRFRIPNVPPGERVVRVWSERLGARRLTVHVPAAGEVNLPVSLDAR